MLTHLNKLRFVIISIDTISAFAAITHQIVFECSTSRSASVEGLMFKVEGLKLKVINFFLKGIEEVGSVGAIHLGMVELER